MIDEIMTPTRKTCNRNIQHPPNKEYRRSKTQISQPFESYNLTRV
jgi:hypothetical protein